MTITLTDIKDGLKTAWHIWEHTSQNANSYSVNRYTDPDNGGARTYGSILTAFGTLGSKTDSRLIRGLKTGTVLSFFFDAPSVYKGLQQGRVKDVIKNETCNLGILATASLIGGYVGFTVGSAVPVIGNAVGAVVGAGLAFGIAYGLEKLRHTYLPGSYLFHS